MTEKKLSTRQVEYAGLHHVLSELSVRGYDTQETKGNVMTNDFMARKADAAPFVGEVKTSSQDKNGWYVREPPSDENTFWFFVILPEKGRGFRVFIARGDEVNKRWFSWNEPDYKQAGFHVPNIKDWEDRWDVLP